MGKIKPTDKLICKKVPDRKPDGKYYFTLNKIYYLYLDDGKFYRPLHIRDDENDTWYFSYEKNDQYYIYNYFENITQNRLKKLKQLKKVCGLKQNLTY